MRRKKEKHTHKRGETERDRGRQVGGRETTLSSLSLPSSSLQLDWSSVSVFCSAHFPSLCFIISRSLCGCNTLSVSLCMYLWLSLFLSVTPPPTLSSSSASGKHCMPLNHIYWAKAACVWVFSHSGCQHFWWGFPLSLSASQLMWFGWAACLHFILPLLITKTLTGWLTTALSDLTVVLAGWLAGIPDIISTHILVFINYSGSQVCLLVHMVPVYMF